jgi:hypothetical protein
LCKINEKGRDKGQTRFWKIFGVFFTQNKDSKISFSGLCCGTSDREKEVLQVAVFPAHRSEHVSGEFRHLGYV